MTCSALLLYACFVARKPSAWESELLLFSVWWSPSPCWLDHATDISGIEKDDAVTWEYPACVSSVPRMQSQALIPVHSVFIFFNCFADPGEQVEFDHIPYRLIGETGTVCTDSFSPSSRARSNYGSTFIVLRLETADSI